MVDHHRHPHEYDYLFNCFYFSTQRLVVSNETLGRTYILGIIREESILLSLVQSNTHINRECTVTVEKTKKGPTQEIC